MNRTIGIAMFFLGVSFYCVLFMSTMNVAVQIQKINDYHYTTVNEIESSDFANVIINERISNSKYNTRIVEKSVKEDLRIYEVSTSTTLKIPILGFSQEYTKVSVAR